MKIHFNQNAAEEKARATAVADAMASSPKPEGSLGKIAARKFLEGKGMSRADAEAALTRIPADERDVNGIIMKSWKIQDLEGGK